MHQDQLVYEFIPTAKHVEPNNANVGFFFIVFAILLYGMFFLIKEGGGTCHINDKIVPCEELTLSTTLFCLGFCVIGLIPIIHSYFHKGKNCTKLEDSYYCYESRIELYGITIKRENMVDIHFGYNIGAKKKKIGYIVINTNSPIYLDDEGEPDNCIVLEDIPNVEDAYLKIKYLYNLPERKR